MNEWMMFCHHFSTQTKKKSKRKETNQQKDKAKRSKKKKKKDGLKQKMKMKKRNSRVIRKTRKKQDGFGNPHFQMIHFITNLLNTRIKKKREKRE